MSYVRKPQALAMAGLDDLANAIGIAADLTSDPYMAETVCRVGQMRSLNRNQKPGACATTPPNLPGGVGLGKLIGPFRAYIYSQENKWVIPVAAVAVIGIPFLLGYSFGKGK